LLGSPSPFPLEFLKNEELSDLKISLKAKIERKIENLGGKLEYLEFTVLI